MNAPRRQRGFTLIEAFIVILVLGALASFYTRFNLQRVQQDRALRAAAQIVTLQEAAYTLFMQTTTWPDEVNNCAGAIAAIQASGLLAAAPASSPWGTNYTTACAAGTRFDVSVDTGAQVWAEYLQSLLPAAARAGTVVTNGVPRTGFGAAGGNVLFRDSDPAAPERNRMDTAIDMNGNDINNANMVAWGGSALRQSADGNAVMELGGTDGTAGSGAPSIDFHHSGLTEDFNVRIVNEVDGVLRVVADTLNVSGDLNSDGVVRADDVLSVNGVELSKQIQIDTILPLDGVLPPGAQKQCIPKPTNCPVGTKADIYVTPSVFSHGNSGLPIVAIQPIVSDTSECAPNWRVDLRVTATNGGVNETIEPNGNYARVRVQTRCAPNI